MFIELTNVFANVSASCPELVNVANVDHFSEYGEPLSRLTDIHFSSGKKITVKESVITIRSKIRSAKADCPA